VKGLDGGVSVKHAAVGLGDFPLKHKPPLEAKVLGERIEGVNVTPHPHDTHLCMGQLRDDAHPSGGRRPRAGIGPTPGRPWATNSSVSQRAKTPDSLVPSGSKIPNRFPCAVFRRSSHSANIDRASSEDPGTLSQPLTNSTSDAASASRSPSWPTS
jgi:hypothetical protein